MHEREYTNVFQDVDYVTKNVRVWGGASTDNQSEHTSKYYASGMGAADSDMEDSKYNRDEYHELLAKRAIVKEKKLEAERKAQEELERLAKLKQKAM